MSPHRENSDHAPAAENTLQPDDPYLKKHAALVLGGCIQKLVSCDKIPWLFLGRNEEDSHFKHLINAYLVLKPDIVESGPTSISFLLKSFLDEYEAKKRLAVQLESEARRKSFETRAGSFEEHPPRPSEVVWVSPDGARCSVYKLPPSLSWHRNIPRLYHAKQKIVLLKSFLDTGFPPSSWLSCWFVFGKAVEAVKQDMLDGYFPPQDIKPLLQAVSQFPGEDVSQIPLLEELIATFSRHYTEISETSFSHVPERYHPQVQNEQFFVKVLEAAGQTAIPWFTNWVMKGGSGVSSYFEWQALTTHKPPDKSPEWFKRIDTLEQEIRNQADLIGGWNDGGAPRRVLNSLDVSARFPCAYELQELAEKLLSAPTATQRQLGNTPCTRHLLEYCAKTKQFWWDGEPLPIKSPRVFDLMWPHIKARGELVKTAALPDGFSDDENVRRFIREQLPPELRDVLRSRPGPKGGRWLDMALVDVRKRPHLATNVQ